MPAPPGPLAFHRVTIRMATDEDRDTIYQQRHAVYAEELGQHASNASGRLSDTLDEFNLYVVAVLAGEMVGFVSITPPARPRYSIDKYFPRCALPFPVDDFLYEVRLLTVMPRYRGGQLGGEIAGLLIYAAFRWVETQGGQRIVAIGRREVLGLYRRVGLQPLGQTVQAGAVGYELLSATIEDLRQRQQHYAIALRQLEPRINWQMGLPYHAASGCAHGGAFFEAIGAEFNELQRSRSVINADVLDAWYSPSPRVLAVLEEHLPWLLRTSPPAHAEGLTQVIAQARGVGPESILPGAGSSALIFLALRQWLSPASRVLLLDPTYGEYTHLLHSIIGCQVERLLLSREQAYLLDPARLEAALSAGYDWVILVNPNSPTGRQVPRTALEDVLSRMPPATKVWIDEAYVDYAGPDESLERYATRSRNVVVCKSMSKVYALSGARVGYLCGPPEWIEQVRPLTPPYAVSLPGQVAAVAALQDPAYYAQRYAETQALREELAAALHAAGLEVIPSSANFLLCHLDPKGPDSATVLTRCRARALFLRDPAGMGSHLGSYALRIAVKDRDTNSRMLHIIRESLHKQPAPVSRPLIGPV